MVARKKSTAAHAKPEGGPEGQSKAPEAGAAGPGSVPPESEPAEPAAAQPADAPPPEGAPEPGSAGRGDAAALNLPDLNALSGNDEEEPAGLALLRDVKLQVKVQLGRTRMYVDDVLRLNENSVIELDKLAGDPVDIYVNDRLVARGEVLVVNDNFCVRISEIIQLPGPEQ